MDASDGDSRYLSNYAGNHGYGLTRPKVSGRDLSQLHSHLIADSYVDEDDEVEEEDEEEEPGDGQMNGSGQPNGDYVDNDDGDDDDNIHSNNNDDDGDGDAEDDKRIVAFNMHKHPKKRKLKSLMSSFELAPRVPPPLPPPATKPGGRNTLTDWSERETFVLLDAWGERFLQRGRKSLRSEEWQEVAEKVSRQSKLERTDTQCRNRLDTLKKKYKKEKALLESNKSLNTKWVYFKKMNMLMVATPPQPPQPPPPRANGLDGLRDSPDDTNSQDDDDDDDLDMLPPKRSKYKGGKVDGVSSFKLLADSINRFSEVYEKIENSKRKQMLELEKMRMDFYKDLELQKMKILDRAKDEIAKIRQGDHHQNDDSAEENLRG